MVADLIVLIVLVGAFYLISAPLRAARRESSAEHAAEVGDLEAARDAKYREIRDAELDLHTGKLSQEDYEAVNGTLRSEAIEILRRLDELQPASHRP